ncbi:ANTAR domain-containing response regulator [Tindallia californiensis]|uniref:Stage 0 sporulation protein A homolog n=1 Tax=Tindallia californiensis TaxID=159292 RepID=A0A1H3LT26_9FIRM|nr:response regulator [Tindallia californiensis]SDY67496.1 response regulator receiver and ANTAR domain protein [Tindallia californiensis]
MSKRIVIADDEPITRMDVAEMLQEAGYDVVGKASDGFDAVEICKKQRPDLAILDVKMPLLDGITAAKKITQENLAGAVLLLTAYSSESFIEKAKQAGVLSYVVKPVTKESLLPAAEIAMHRGREIEDIKKAHEKTARRLEARVLVDRAKSALMSQNEMSEEAAYNYIRKMSMDKRCSMQEIASTILMSIEG